MDIPHRRGRQPDRLESLSAADIDEAIADLSAALGLLADGEAGAADPQAVRRLGVTYAAARRDRRRAMHPSARPRLT